MAKTKTETQELEEVLQIVADAWKDRNNPEARLEMVQELLAKEFKRGQIVRIVTKAYGCASISVDRDIAKAKKSFVDWLRHNDQEKHLGKAVARMITVIREAYRKGELNSVIQASKHHDQLLGLIDAEITIGGKIDLTLEKIRDDIKSKLDRVAKSQTKKRFSKKSDK